MQRWSWDLSSSDREDLEEPFGECSQGLWPGVPRSSQGQCQSQDSHSSLSDEWQDTALCFDATMKSKTKPNSPAVIDCTFQWCQNLFSGLMGMSMSPPSVVSNKWQVLSPHDEWHSEQGQDGQGAGSVSQAPAEWGAVKSQPHDSSFRVLRTWAGHPSSLRLCLHRAEQAWFFRHLEAQLLSTLNSDDLHFCWALLFG